MVEMTAEAYRESGSVGGWIIIDKDSVEVFGVRAGRRQMGFGFNECEKNEKTSASCTTSRSSTSQTRDVHDQQGHFVYRLGRLAADGTELSVETFAQQAARDVRDTLRRDGWRR